MATKQKDGSWAFTDAEEAEMAQAEEVRVRAARRLREEGKAAPWDGKTERRGKESKDRRAPKEDKNTPPKKKGGLSW